MYNLLIVPSYWSFLFAMIRPCLCLKFSQSALISFSQSFLISFSHHTNLRYAHEFILSRRILNKLLYNGDRLHKEIILIHPQPVMFCLSATLDKFARGYLDLCFVDFTPHSKPVAETLQGVLILNIGDSDATFTTLVEVKYRTPMANKFAFQFLKDGVCCTVCSLCSGHLGRFEVSAH